MDSRKLLSTGARRVLGGIEYKIECVIGSGASTIVYEASYMDALNKEYEHKVLLKELYPYDDTSMIYRNDDGFLCWEPSREKMMEDHKYFFRKGNEMNIRLLEKNPKDVSGNVNSFEAYGTYYSILPVHGVETLEKYLKENKGRMESAKEAAEILLQIIDALRLFHENGFLNLDISPDNILILDGRAMFIDYNSVWDLNDLEGDCFLSQKEGYTAPEILLQEFDEIGYASDLYSVSAVFYQMLFGERFDLNHRGWEKIGSKVQEYFEKEKYQNTGQSLRIRKMFLEERQEELISLLKQGLHPLGEKRFQNVDEYENQIKKFLATYEKEKEDDRGVKVKSFTLGAAALLLALLGVLGGRYVIQEQPWLPRIISQGNTNANIYNKSRFCLAEQEYEYYIDADGNLIQCDYDAESDSYDLENGSIVLRQDDQVEGDGVDFLNLGTDSSGKKNKLYFCHYGGEGNADSIMSMNLDGSEQEVLFAHGEDEIGDFYSYAHLADGREYIYYMVGTATEEGYAEDYTLWRYDINKGEQELLVDTSVQWFNIYDKYIYYVEYDYDQESYILMKATLDGKGKEILDDKNQYFCGFVQDDRMFLERFLENEYSIQSCNLEGEILYDKQGIYGLDLSEMEIGYDDGWLYYSKEGQNELRKVRLDGTADKLVHEGMDCYGINCVKNYLFVAVAPPAEGEFLSNDDILEDYIIERNGDGCFKVR